LVSSLFETLPFQTTSATVIDRSTSTFTEYGEPVWVEGTAATTSGFFQTGIARGVSRADPTQEEAGQLLDYDAALYLRPSSTIPSAENDIVVYRGTRYRVRNRNPVNIDGDTIDHWEIFLSREEGIK